MRRRKSIGETRNGIRDGGGGGGSVEEPGEVKVEEIERGEEECQREVERA